MKEDIHRFVYDIYPIGKRKISPENEVTRSAIDNYRERERDANTGDEEEEEVNRYQRKWMPLDDATVTHDISLGF